MSLPVSWRQSAREDVRRIVRFIARNSPKAAREMRMRIEASVLPVSAFPYMFRKSDRIPGCREILAHPNYIVLYQVKDRIEIVAVVHAHRAIMPDIDS